MASLTFKILAFGIVKCTAEIVNCNLITQHRFWQFSTATRYYNNHHCQSYGAEYASIHSLQDIDDILDLTTSCHRYLVYVGLEVSSCLDDANFTLKWADNTFMNYSYINWCNGYPMDLCDKSVIYFNVSASCFTNGYDTEKPAVCGNPNTC